MGSSSAERGRAFVSMYESSLGYKRQNFVDYPPANYTPPNKPSFVDIFKGDDTDRLLFKTYLMAKYTTSATAFTSMMDIIVGTQPKNLTGCLQRIGFWGVPLIGGGLAYTSIVCVAGSLRKKNDQGNHVCGGIAAGTIFGAARKSYLFGILTGALAVALGVLYKESIIENYEVFPYQLPPKRGWTFSHKSDMSLHRDVPGNWFKDPTPQPTPSSPSCD